MKQLYVTVPSRPQLLSMTGLSVQDAVSMLLPSGMKLTVLPPSAVGSAASDS